MTSQKEDKDMTMYLLGGGILLVLLLAFSYSYSSSTNCTSHSVEQTERNDFKSLTETLFTAPVPVATPMPFVVQPTELVVPSVGGIVLQGGTNNYIRVAGTATTDATRNTVGTTNNQVQIYNAGNLTAAFDVDGLYVRALNVGSGNITTTGSIGISGTPVGAVYCGSINAGSGNITTTGSIGISGTPVGAVYCGAITSGAINAGSGNITTTGSVTSNSVVVGSGGIQIAYGSNNFIYATTYDGYTPASLNNNLIIKSWHGIGFATYDSSVRVTINTRSGDANFSGTVDTGGEVYAGNWFRVKNQACGLWWETPGAGITSAVGGGNQYGTICATGTGRNSWSGYGIGTRHCFMGNGTECGIYDNNGPEWYIRFDTSRKCYIPGTINAGGLTIGTTAVSNMSSFWAYGIATNGLCYSTGCPGGGTGAGTYIQPYGSTSFVADFTGNILARNSIYVLSDKRVKKDIIPIQNSLDTIRQLEPVSFHFIDEIQKGSSVQHGFIAQDVKKVNETLTESYTKDFIPNIYDFATIQGNVLQLRTKPFTMEMKRIKIYNDVGQEELDIQVIDSTTCHLQSDVSYSSCFVYGSYVEDVHSIKKDEIFSIGISAIKEIDKKQLSLEEKIVQLEEIIHKQNERIIMLEKKIL